MTTENPIYRYQMLRRMHSYAAQIETVLPECDKETVKSPRDIQVISVSTDSTALPPSQQS